MNGTTISGTAEGAQIVKPSKRPMAGLLGIFLAAMMAGLNNRVGALALVDIRGELGFAFDDASWLSTVYNAGELIAMPFAAWFAITLSVRRFELWMLGVCTVLALFLPFIHDLNLLLVVRFLQGVACGTMIPVLMMAALKFLPPPVKLYGLAMYAMTATFAPNISIWLAGYWIDGLYDWRWVFWQIVPVAIVAGLLVSWGLPREPVQVNRFRQGNWSGMVCGMIALGLIAVAFDQGIRLDWFHSPLIRLSLQAGFALMAVYLISEWYHPSPFIKLQILGRWNLALGFTVFVSLLVVLISSSLLPASYLAAVRDYRPRQMALIGLIIAIPQFLLGGAVAFLLYQTVIDARDVFASGLFLITLACFSGTQLTSDWSRDQFVVAQILQAFGQPMAVVSMLFLLTSVVQPHEGPYVSGSINALRAFGSLFGAAVVGQFVIARSRFHSEMLLDHAALVGNSAMNPPEPAHLIGIISQQSLVLSVADTYRALGILALLLIPVVLRLNYIPAPVVRNFSSTSPVPSSTYG
jgi:MFS transporter, DHA2 family, multidrug resistance protein